MLPGCMVAKPKDLRSVPIPRLSRRLLGPRPSFSRCCSQRHRSARSAWRPRWKSPSEWTSSLLYAPHDSAPLPFALARKDPRMKMADLQRKDTKHETRTTSTRVNAGFQREFSRAQTTTPASLAGGGPPWLVNDLRYGPRWRFDEPWLAPLKKQRYAGSGCPFQISFDESSRW